ncbi:MAG: hypothetical protein JW749_07735 [Sedimentisphaerales bacterium]|nr:hypothetical protein [Sedimentisphaerales bacterium]
METTTTREKVVNLPVIALAAVNMLPIYGVVVLGWDTFTIVVLYWAENLIIGFYNILKIVFARVARPIDNLGKLFLIPFFTIHYGGFVAIHGIFIFLLFGKDKGGSTLNTGQAWPCFLVFLQLLIGVVWHCWTTIPRDMKYIIGSLFLSHGVSFVHNYLIGGEYKTAKPKDLMGQPYSRVVVMHVAILAGAFLSAMIGSPAGVLIVLIVVKTIIDIKLHLNQHKAAFRPAAQRV